MIFTKLVPNIFYKDINTGLKIFVDCLEFTIGHNEINTKNPKERRYKSTIRFFY